MSSSSSIDGVVITVEVVVFDESKAIVGLVVAAFPKFKVIFNLVGALEVVAPALKLDSSAFPPSRTLKAAKRNLKTRGSSVTRVLRSQHFKSTDSSSME